MDQPILPPPLSDGSSPPPQPSPPRDNAMAIAALVLGIVSLAVGPLGCVCPPMGLASPPSAVLAVIFGIVARLQIARGQGAGAAKAIAGLTCGLAALVIMAFLVLMTALES